MKKKTMDLTRWFPVGFDAQSEKNWISFGVFFSIVISALTFGIRYSSARELLYNIDYETGKRVLLEYVPMADFKDVLSFSMAGFYILFFVMIALAYVHYNYHFQGSKSIYLMKRLPDRWEFARRCFAVPIAVTLLTAIIVLLLIIIYYQIYIAITPKACLVPGQWEKLWSFSRV